MSDIRLFSNNDDDDGGRLARGLRALYAAPSGDSYWNELEARIMSRVRPALAAAAVLLIAAGVAMFRARQAENDIAVDSMLSSPAVPVSTAIRPALSDDREARIRFLFGSGR